MRTLVLLGLLLTLFAVPVAGQSGRTGCYMTRMDEPANGAAGVRLVLVQYFPTRAMLYAWGATMATPPDQSELRTLGAGYTTITRQWLLDPSVYVIEFAGLTGGFTHELELPADTLVTIFAECM